MLVLCGAILILIGYLGFSYIKQNDKNEKNNENVAGTTAFLKVESNDTTTLDQQEQEKDKKKSKGKKSNTTKEATTTKEEQATEKKEVKDKKKVTTKDKTTKKPENSTTKVVLTTQKAAATTTRKPLHSTTKVPSGPMKASLTITCANILKNMDQLKPGKEGLVPKDGIVLKKSQVTISSNTTAFSFMQKLTREENITMESEYTPGLNSWYIEGINNIYEKDCGKYSGWMYKVNGQTPMVAADQYELKNQDHVVFIYTCNGGRDIY